MQQTLQLIEEADTVGLDAIARACGVDSDWVMELVGAGILQPLHNDAASRFAASAMFTARSVLRMQRDLGLNLDGAALVLELLARNQRLREQLLRDGQAPLA